MQTLCSSTIEPKSRLILFLHKSMRLGQTANVILLVAALLIQGSAYACSREPRYVEPTPAENYARAKLVFIGHITGLRETRGMNSLAGPLESPLLASITVMEKLKGDVAQEITLKGKFFDYGYICSGFGMAVPGMDSLFMINSLDLTEEGSTIQVIPLDSTKNPLIEVYRKLAHSAD